MSQWAPSVDVYETENDIVVKAELPGVQQKDVNVSFENNILTIRGERCMDNEAKEENYHRVECSYGSFERSFSLPTTFDENKVNDPATFDDPHHFGEGVLDVVVNGTPVLRDSQMTNALPGHTIRGAGYHGKR